MARLRLATVWLGGCSGCHMSFLDLDEWLVDLAGVADFVYTPLMDAKTYPENVDAVLVEGAVANEDNLELIRRVRARTRVLISFGDCAVTGNVTAMRNPLGPPREVLDAVYVRGADLNPGVPDADVLPQLLDRVQPLHVFVPVDFYMPGCPPPAARIRRVLEALVADRPPQLEGDELRFG
jgi:NAD-reducing hydrogenase small subunit